MSGAGPRFPRRGSARRRREQRLLTIWSVCLIGAAAVGWAVSQAVTLAWLSDDAFISFRYAQNLVRGHGLVFNVGERVEGYTNLLWTLLLAGAMAAGISPEVAAAVGGIAFWLALVAVLALWSWRWSGARPVLPLAASLVLLMPDFQMWATGGLETSMFACLSVAGLVLASRAGASRSHLLVSGALLAAAVATRPDGVIFAAVGVAAAWFLPSGLALGDRISRTLALALPLIVSGVALVVFKLAYYGDLFPTAFYAKSALHPYYSQGLIYVYIFFKQNWFIVPLTVAAAVVGVSRRPAVMSGASWVFLAAFGLFTLYVIHSAGDFMFARRLLPAVPFLFLVLEDLLRAIAHPMVRIAVVALAVVGACLPYPVYGRAVQQISGISNEPAFYGSPYIETRRVQAKAAAKALTGLPVRAIFTGGMCMFAYYSELPYLVEEHGLTQYSVAKKPLAARDRVGHEKIADQVWATEHNIHLTFMYDLPPVSPAVPREADEIFFGDRLKARIWTYDDAIMDRLRANPAVSFVPIEVTLAAAREQIDQRSHEHAEGVLAFLERYYFRTAGPEKRPLAEALKARVEAKKLEIVSR